MPLPRLGGLCLRENPKAGGGRTPIRGFVPALVAESPVGSHAGVGARFAMHEHILADAVDEVRPLFDG